MSQNKESHFWPATAVAYVLILVVAVALLVRIQKLEDRAATFHSDIYELRTSDKFMPLPPPTDSFGCGDCACGAAIEPPPSQVDDDLPPVPPEGSEHDPAYEGTVTHNPDGSISLGQAPVYQLPITYIDADLHDTKVVLDFSDDNLASGEELLCRGPIMIRFVNRLEAKQ